MTMTDAWSPVMSKTDETTEAHELDNLEVQLVPNEEPPHPKAVQWVQDAYNADGQHGELPVKDEAQFERVRGYLRRAAESLNLTATCKMVKDSKDKVTGLSFTVGARRGRKQH